MQHFLQVHPPQVWDRRQSGSAQLPQAQERSARFGNDLLSEAGLQRQGAESCSIQKEAVGREKKQESGRKTRQKGKRWEAEFLVEPSLQHLGRGLGTKQRLQVRSALGVSEKRVLRRSRSPLGMPGAPEPRVRSWAPLTFAGAPARTSGDCARGAWGRAGGPGADHRGADATKRCPGLRPAPAPRKGILPEGPPGSGLAWGRGVPAWVLTGGGAKPRRSWRSPSQWEEKVVSFPSISPLLHPLGSGPALPLPRPLLQASGPCGRPQDAKPERL